VAPLALSTQHGPLTPRSPPQLRVLVVCLAIGCGEGREDTYTPNARVIPTYWMLPEALCSAILLGLKGWVVAHGKCPVMMGVGRRKDVRGWMVDSSPSQGRHE